MERIKKLVLYLETENLTEISTFKKIKEIQIWNILGTIGDIIPLKEEESCKLKSLNSQSHNIEQERWICQNFYKEKAYLISMGLR